jgi:hypothetical protein
MGEKTKRKIKSGQVFTLGKACLWSDSSMGLISIKPTSEVFTLHPRSLPYTNPTGPNTIQPTSNSIGPHKGEQSTTKLAHLKNQSVQCNRMGTVWNQNPKGNGPVNWAYWACHSTHSKKTKKTKTGSSSSRLKRNKRQGKFSRGQHRA